MKRKSDPRHINRIHLMQSLFSWDFNSQKAAEILPIIKHVKKLDTQIKKAAPAWPIEQINRIDLAILRLAVYEVIIDKDTPYKVVVDEAVELAKEYGGESSPSFINGVLGKVIEINHINNATKNN